MEINVLTPSEAFYWMATTALNHGTVVSPRGMKTTEVQNFTCSIKHPHLVPVEVEGRDLRPFIGAVEALQLIGQAATPELVVAGSRAMAEYMDDGVFSGAYGQRAYGQLAHVERLLSTDSATRQAVVTIYSGQQDLGKASKDVPCTVSIQFLWQPGADMVRLGMRVSMRSNDVWLGLPYDLFQFASLQMAMCDALGVEPGNYVHTVGSLHAYERDWDKISTLRNPGQPETHLLAYEPRWGGIEMGIGAISSRARQILAGSWLDNETPYERALRGDLEVGR